MDLSERILNTTAQKAGIDRSLLTEHTAITELPIDSLAFMDLVMQLEDAEGVNLNDEEIEAVLSATTLAEVVGIIAAAKANAVSNQGGLA